MLSVANALLIFALIVAVIAAIGAAVYVGINGWPLTRGHLRAWRVRRRYRNEIALRALRIQELHPEIPYHCSNWPRWPRLCGRCCAVSRAELELREERASVPAGTVSAAASVTTGP